MNVDEEDEEQDDEDEEDERDKEVEEDKEDEEEDVVLEEILVHRPYYVDDEIPDSDDF
jgi:hypothetical protein